MVTSFDKLIGIGKEEDGERGRRKGGRGREGGGSRMLLIDAHPSAAPPSRFSTSSIQACRNLQFKCLKTATHKTTKAGYPPNTTHSFGFSG